MDDVFFDLANFSAHYNSDLREATWGLAQMGISRFDFDFRAYADKYFGRVMNNIHNPHWDEYLKEVS